MEKIIQDILLRMKEELSCLKTMREIEILNIRQIENNLQTMMKDPYFTPNLRTDLKLRRNMILHYDKEINFLEKRILELQLIFYSTIEIGYLNQIP